MSDQVRLDNIGRVFTVFDTNGDGEITWEDFGGKARAIGAEFGLEVESPEVEAATEAYREVWDYIRGADVDEDGVVEEAEFRQAHTSGRLDIEELLEKWQAVTDRVFDMIDGDGDGYVDEDEFAGMYRAAGVTDPQVAEIAFEAMDLDGDGRLSRTELLAQVRGLFTATDESEKGARLLTGN